MNERVRRHHLSTERDPVPGMLSASGEGQESSPQPPSYPRSESQAPSPYLPVTVSCPWGGRTEEPGRVPVFPCEGLGAADHPCPAPARTPQAWIPLARCGKKGSVLSGARWLLERGSQDEHGDKSGPRSLGHSGPAGKGPLVLFSAGSPGK